MASSRSVNQSTFVPEIHFSEIMESNSGLTINRIATVTQVLKFFLEDSPTSFCICMLIITIGSESGDHIFFFLFAIFILHSRESDVSLCFLDGKSALAWELPFPGHLSST